MDSESPAGDSSPRRRRRWRVVLGLVVTVLIALGVVGGLLALTARQAQHQAAALQQAVETARTHATQGAFDTLPPDLQAVEKAAGDLTATTTSWQWAALARIPGMAGTVDAVPVVAATVEGLATAAQPLAQAVQDAPSTLALVQSLPQLEPAVQGLQQASQDAAGELAAVAQGDLRFGLAEQVAQAQEATQSIDDAATAALDAWPALQGLLGFDGPRTYLVMLQNPAESRGSGGLFSAFMRVTLDRGVPTIEEANSRKVLDETRIPLPSDLDPGEKALWGDFLTKWASFNTSPDFPTTARLAQAGMQARGTPVDGVVAIDPFTVQAILAGTGPVEHKGVTIDGTTAAEFFTKGIYQDFPGFDDVDAKDELALGLLYATVDSVLKRPLDLRALSEQVPATIEQGHLKAWVPDATEQAWLQEAGLAFDLASLDPGTTVIALNNGVGGKVDAYVDVEVTQSIGTCTNATGSFTGWQQSELDITLTNNAPADLPTYVDTRLDDPSAARGSTKILISILGIEGAVDDGLTLDGDFADYASSQAHSRPLWVTEVELDRGQSRSLTLVANTPPDSPGPQSTLVAGSYAPATITTDTKNSTEPCSGDVG